MFVINSLDDMYNMMSQIAIILSVPSRASLGVLRLATFRQQYYCFLSQRELCVIGVFG